MNIKQNFSAGIVRRNIDSLKPWARNARTHSKRQIKLLARSIEEFGFTVPVLIDEKDNVLAGHGRLEASRSIGLQEVPTLRVDHLTEAQKRAYVIADNRIAEQAGWDEDMLLLEFADLSADLSADASGIDLGVTGFAMGEIDLMFDRKHAVDDSEVDVVPLPERDETAVTEPGSVWQLGDHLILCGSSLDQQSYERLLGSERAGMVFTDPPYNVPVDGHVCGLGKVHHKEFAMASGEMNSSQFTEFLRKAFELAVAFSSDRSVHHVFMDWRHMREILDAGNSVYDTCLALCIWVKTNAGMGSLYRSRHELVFVFRNGKDSHVNNVELGRHGRHRSNVWTYPGANTFGSSRDGKLELHPTVKPVALVADAIMDCSNRGDIILDPFGGSGTTLLAAERTGRRARLIEIDPAYVDVSIRRWQDITGNDAIHRDTGITFNELANLDLG